MQSADAFHGSLLPAAAAAAFLVLAGTGTAQAQSGGTAAVKSDATGCVNDAGLKLPTGFCASIFADKLGHVRHMVVSPNGVLYANTWSGRYFANSPPPPGGFLLALQDTSGHGRADVIRRFGATPATGGHGGTGIALYGGYLYAELNDRIVRYRMSPHSIVPKGRAETVISGLPLTGDHPMHPFIIDADGWIYMDSGSPSNSCQRENRMLESPGVDPCPELATRAGIWRYSAKKLHQKFSPAARYATGIRNGEGLAFDSEGHLYSTQHGRDQLSQNWPKFYTGEQGAYLPAEEVMRVVRAGDYGWPYCYYDGVQRKLMLAPEYGGNGKNVGLCAGKLAPAAAFPGHWAPMDLAFYYAKQFPPHYEGGAFIAFHGSWNRAPFPQQGYDVVFQPLADGRAAGNCEIFADGFSGGERDPGAAAHRPSGLAVGPDGALYVSDDRHGRIYKIVYRGGSGSDGASGVTECPGVTAVGSTATAANSVPPEGIHPAASLPVAPGATRDMVDLGDRIFHGEVASGTCAGCHGAAGNGTPLAPDLTSGKWMWSDGSLSGIENTIRHGVPNPKQYRSPMPAMGGAQLDKQQISAVAAYVWGLGHAAGSR
ncbi:MAG: c-type cytochrome [Gammaproteobacteria bacterium]|nr:c-type cytochrome [Gammaproteobacteria bacterium]